MKDAGGFKKMKNALDIKIGGLKCDNPNCDYEDMDIDAKDYEKYVNTKCPKCGQILLTEKDYLNSKFLLGMVDLANEIYPQIEDNEKTVSASVKMDGSGKIDFDMED